MQPDENANSQDTLRIDKFIPEEPEVVPFQFDDLVDNNQRQLTIELGTTNRRRSQLNGINAGQVLILDNETDDSVILRSADGVAIAIGKLVVSEDRIAIKIERRLNEKRHAV